MPKCSAKTIMAIIWSLQPCFSLSFWIWAGQVTVVSTVTVLQSFRHLSRERDESWRVGFICVMCLHQCRCRLQSLATLASGEVVYQVLVLSLLQFLSVSSCLLMTSYWFPVEREKLNFANICIKRSCSFSSFKHVGLVMHMWENWSIIQIWQFAVIPKKAVCASVLAYCVLPDF